MKKAALVAIVAGMVSAAPTANAEITVGFSGPLSGQQAVLGQDQLDGFMLGLEQLNGKFGQHKVKVVIEDDQLKPDVGAQIIQKFIERDKVDVVVGLGFSNVLMATLRQIKSSGVPAIATNAGPGPIAGKLCIPNLFTLAWQNDTVSEAMGQYVRDVGHKNAYLMTSNFQAGRDLLVGFKRFYGGEILNEVYTPLGQLDYSAEISKMQDAKPDALFVFYSGGAGVNFVRQLRQAGVIGRIPVYSAGGTIDANTLVALKTQADGVYYGATWSHVLDNPQNKQFVKQYEEKYKRTPSEFAANAYDAAFLLDAAVRRLDGKSTDRENLVQAIKNTGHEFPTVRGKFAFNSNNMPVQNLYAFQAVAEGDEITVKEVATAFSDHQDAYVSECTMK